MAENKNRTPFHINWNTVGKNLWSIVISGPVTIIGFVAIWTDFLSADLLAVPVVEILVISLSVSVIFNFIMFFIYNSSMNSKDQYRNLYEKISSSFAILSDAQPKLNDLLFYTLDEIDKLLSMDPDKFDPEITEEPQAEMAKRTRALIDVAKEQIEALTAEQGASCSINIKLLPPPDENVPEEDIDPDSLMTTTLARDSRSILSRNKVSPPEHEISKNYFLKLLLSKTDKPNNNGSNNEIVMNEDRRYIYSNNLKETEYFNAHNPAWNDFYNSALVFSLYDDFNKEYDPDLPVGFFCIDSKTMIFDDDLVNKIDVFAGMFYAALRLQIEYSYATSLIEAE